MSVKLRNTKDTKIQGYSIVSFFLLCFLAHSSQAGKYELVKGKGVEVCEAYAESLNNSNPKFPFEYRTGGYPKITGFEPPPEWKHIPFFYQEDGAIEKIDRFLWERDHNPVYFIPYTEWKDWRGTPEQHDRAWKQFNRVRKIGPLAIAKIDVDNDGAPENVCDCGPPLVLSDDLKDIDYRKTELLTAHPSRKVQGLGELRKVWPGEYRPAPITEKEKLGVREVEDAPHHATYGFFRYAGKTYFDLWWTSHPDYRGEPAHEAGRLRVFTIDNQKRREICTYRFVMIQN